jgi:hypothetical protein
LRPPLPDWPDAEFRFVREACKTSEQDNTPIRTQMLTDLQSSSWQEKLYSGFCVTKYLMLAMLGVEAIVAFLIVLRLRIAWAVTLNRFIRYAALTGLRQGRPAARPALRNSGRNPTLG